MKRVSVESSSLKSVGYSAEGQRLQVEFINGLVYDYFGVQPAMHEALMVASSKGSYFNTQVKERFRFERRLLLSEIVDGFVSAGERTGCRVGVLQTASRPSASRFICAGP